MLGKIATAGQNGQFRTPRHIIRLMVELTAPQPADAICDPACGTAGFLVAAGEYLRKRHPELLHDARLGEHFHHGLFHGFDFDNTMLRIGSMNMLLHGVENPDIRYRDSLAQEHEGEEEKYTLVLANPPFAGSLDYENTAKDLLQIVKTKRTELLFLALFLRLQKPGGRAAVIVPDGVLFGSSKAHKELRRILVEDQKLDAVVSLPSGAFKPYAGVSTAILLFTKTNSGGTDYVWFYHVTADGWSLDDKRTPLMSENKLGAVPRTALDADEHAKNNLPDVLARWAERAGSERDFPPRAIGQEVVLHVACARHHARTQFALGSFPALPERLAPRHTMPVVAIEFWPPKWPPKVVRLNSPYAERVSPTITPHFSRTYTAFAAQIIVTGGANHFAEAKRSRSTVHTEIPPRSETRNSQDNPERPPQPKKTKSSVLLNGNRYAPGVFLMPKLRRSPGAMSRSCLTLSYDRQHGGLMNPSIRGRCAEDPANAERQADPSLVSPRLKVCRIRPPRPPSPVSVTTATVPK